MGDAGRCGARPPEGAGQPRVPGLGTEGAAVRPLPPRARREGFGAGHHLREFLVLGEARVQGHVEGFEGTALVELHRVLLEPDRVAGVRVREEVWLFGDDLGLAPPMRHDPLIGCEVYELAQTPASLRSEHGTSVKQPVRDPAAPR